MTIDTSREAVERLLDGVTPGPWEYIIGHSDWGLPRSNAVVPVGMSEFYFDAMIAEVHSTTPYCAGSSRKDRERSATADANASFIAAARDLVPALLARAEAAEDKIENAVQAMAETQPSWEYRCHAIVSALGVNFGGPTPEGIPEEHTWYARNLKRANTERDSAVERASVLKAERDAALAEVARLSTPPDDAEVRERICEMVAQVMHPSVRRMTIDTLTRLSHALAAETAKREAMEGALGLIRRADDLRDLYHKLPNDKNRIGEKRSRKSHARDAWLRAFRKAAASARATLAKHGSKT